MIADDELVLPVRTRDELRHEVGARVVKATRRRRARRASLSLAVVVAVVVPVLRLAGPALDTTVGTPASERPVDDPGGAHGVDGGGGESVATAGTSGGGDVRRSTASTSLVPSPGPGVPGLFPKPGPPPPDNATGPARSQQFRLALTRYEEIWEANGDGTFLRLLVADGRQPTWSPDGRRLAYIDNDGTIGPSTVAILDLDTMQTRVVVSRTDAGYGQPTFSADGTLLAFSKGTWAPTTPSELETSIMVVDLDGPQGNDRWEFGPGDIPSFSPDGRILFRCDNRLCLADSDGTDQVVVPNSDKLLSATVSPDGRWLASTSYSSTAIEVMRLDGTDRRTLDARTTGAGPAWAPDSATLFYPTGYGIRTIARDGGEVRSVTAEFVAEVAVTRR